MDHNMEVVQLPMSFCVNEKYTMRKNLPKTLDLSTDI